MAKHRSDVGLRLEHFQLEFEFRRLPPIVLVKKGQKLTFRLANPKVTGRCRPSVRLVEISYASAVRWYEPSTAVRGSIVYHDDLGCRSRLFEYAFDRFCEVAFAVEDRDNDADSHNGGISMGSVPPRARRLSSDRLMSCR